jgi:uncharacterized protein
MYKYVGEEGDRCPLKAAISVGNPFNLELSNKGLQRSFLGHQVYQRAMGCKHCVNVDVLRFSVWLIDAAANMKRLISRHKDAVLKHTNLDYDRIQQITYLYEFDREVQYAAFFLHSIQVPKLVGRKYTHHANRTVTWGYPTETAYYRDASSSDAVLAIKIPFFAIAAEDDPVSDLDF